MSFRYEAPASLADAVRLLRDDPGAKLFAGGTDILVQLKNGRTPPSALIDLKRIAELTSITLDGKGLRLGAAAAAAEIGDRADIAALWPGLVEAVGLIGSMQIQGRGSVGGNLCNASPAADSVCALIVNQAECTIAGPNGQRTVPVEQFVVGPGKTVLGPGELLVSLWLPRPAARTADAYLRLIPRTEMDIAVVGAAVRVTLDAKGTCTAARVALGAVAPTAILVPEAAQALVGTVVDAAALAKAAAASSAAAKPIDDKRGTAEYRKTIAGVLTKRTAEIAARRAKER